MKKKFYTHAGFFHADEVTAFAILRLAKVCDTFYRLTDLSEIPDDGIVGDIGREYDPDSEKYDHHHGFFTRELSGYPLATAGMIWKEYWLDAVNALGYGGAGGAMAERVDETLILGIDAHDADNAYHVTATCSAGQVRPLTVSHIIAGMNSNDVSNADKQDARFREAANLMQSILESHIRQAAKYIEACDKFEQVATVEGEVITLAKGLPWKEIVHERYPDALFVILPSNHPGNPWSMTAISVTPESRELKKAIERPDWFNGFIHQGKWIAGGSNPDELKRLAAYNGASITTIH